MRDWLPVLIVCKGSAFFMGGSRWGDPKILDAATPYFTSAHQICIFFYNFLFLYFYNFSHYCVYFLNSRHWPNLYKLGNVA